MKCLWTKMYLGRRRCIYEREDVFMKGKCIYEGKIYLWKIKKYPGNFEEIESEIFFKTQKNP